MEHPFGRIVDRPITVLMIHVAVVVLAFFELSHLPVQLSPETDLPRLSVVTDYPGASSELVAQSITLPIEEAASTLDEVKDISSTSQQGESTVNIQLQKNSDVDFVRLNLLEKLSTVVENLPNGAGYPTIVKYVPEDIRRLQGFMTYTIYGNKSLAEIEKFAEKRVKSALLSVRGVASVRVIGGGRPELYVLADRNKMRAYGVSFRNLVNAIQESQYVKSAGELVTKDVRESVLVGNEIRDRNDIKNIMIGGNGDGGTVRLGEFARVVDSISAPTTLVRINGKPSVTVEIDKEPGTNMLTVSSSVDAVVSKIAKAFPFNLRIEKVSDKSGDVRREVDQLSSKALYAALLILVVVFLFFFQKRHLLGNLLISIVMVISVIFSLGVGIIFLSMSGIGLNVITLAALALSLGIAIDNNVVVSESIVREFEKGGNGDGEKRRNGDTGTGRQGESGSGRDGDLIANAEKQIVLPLIAATLTTVGALLPVFFLPPDLKQFFIPFAETTAVVVISSLVVAFTFLPVSMMFIDSYQQSAMSNQPSATKSLSILKRFYIRTSKWLINHKVISVIIALWLVGFPIWLLPERIDYSSGTIQRTKSQVEASPVSGLLPPFSSFREPFEKIVSSLVSAYNAIFGSNFYQNIRPYLDYGLGGATQLFFRHVYKGELWQFGSETYLVMSIYAPQGTPIDEIYRFAKQIENVVQPDQKWIKRMTTRVMSGYASVRIDFADSVASTVVPFILKDRLTSLGAQAGGFTVLVSGFGPGYYSGGGTSPSFTVNVSGYNYESVREIAQRLGVVLSQNPRVANLQIDRLPWENENYEILGKINRGYLNSMGLSVNELLNQLDPFVTSSLGRSSIIVNDHSIDLIVKFNNYSNQSVGNLPSQEIHIGDQKLFKVGNVVAFKKTPVMPVIERDNRQYVRYVTFDFLGPYNFGDKYTDRVVKSFQVPPGYEVKRQNHWFTFEPKETIPLVLLGALAVVIVFMVTASLHESYRKPFVVILSVPMSLIGLFTTFFFTNANFGRGGYAAVLFLIGLSVNNGILLVDRMNLGMAEMVKVGLGDGETGGKGKRAGLIAEAASERLRPILMTMLITTAGFIPFVINADIYSFWYTFSLGIIGGVVVSSLMILLFTPVFYELAAGKGAKGMVHSVSNRD